MKSIVVAMAAWVTISVAAAPAAGEAFYLEGEIRSAFDWNRVLLNTEGGPLTYRGVFTYDLASSRAAFEISVLGGWPSTDLLSSKLFDGTVENYPAQLVVDLDSLPAPLAWNTSFELVVEKATGQGEWFWSESPQQACTPTVCAPSLPPSTAVGTITAFRAVPEPGSFAMMIAVGIWSWRRRR